MLTQPGFWADRHASSSKRDAAGTSSSSSTDVSTETNAQKRMEDSYVEVDLPFETEPALLEQYIGAFTSVRIGRIMEGTFGTTASQATCERSHVSSGYYRLCLVCNLKFTGYRLELASKR